MYQGMSQIKYYKRKLRKTKDTRRSLQAILITKKIIINKNKNDKKNPGSCTFEFDKKAPCASVTVIK